MFLVLLLFIPHRNVPHFRYTLNNKGKKKQVFNFITIYPSQERTAFQQQSPTGWSYSRQYSLLFKNRARSISIRRAQNAKSCISFYTTLTWSTMINICTCCFNRRWWSAVGVAHALRTGRFDFRIPPGARNLSLLLNVQTDSRAHPVSYSMSTRLLSQA